MDKKTQAHLAHLAAITPSYLSMILSGTRRPGYLVSSRLARETRTDPLMWMRDDPVPKRDAVDAYLNRRDAT